MAPGKVDDDPVTAEYDVYLTPVLEEQVYLLQYPNRPRNRPYSEAAGATPKAMRVKPRSGYLEMDVRLVTGSNFNKYTGLKWGEATRASKLLHNSTGTFGPAAGLALAQRTGGAAPRGAHVLTDKAERDMEVESELQTFAEAERDERVFNTQTLGGQIVWHNGNDGDQGNSMGSSSRDAAGKPFYFVGAFDGSSLHLSRIAGTAQMRPQFHHIDAEEERNRITASRAQGDTAATSATPGGPGGGGGGGSGGTAATGQPPVARTLQPRYMQEDEKDSHEARMRRMLYAAEQEPWIEMEYIDEDADEAFDAFHEKLFVRDTAAALPLQSAMDNEAYLDAISAPRRDSPTRRRKRPPRRKGVVELDDEEKGQADDVEDDEAEE